MNLFITMLLGGLWHGASWHFVVWGGFHGALLAVNRVIDEIIAKNKVLETASKTWYWTAMAQISTFLLVCIGWVVFRANNMSEALNVYQAMFTLRPSSTTETTITELFLQSTLPIGLTLYTLAFSAFKLQSKLNNSIPLAIRTFRTPAYVQAVALAGFAVLVVGLAPQKSIPFIYFRF